MILQMGGVSLDFALSFQVQWQLDINATQLTQIPLYLACLILNDLILALNRAMLNQFAPSNSALPCARFMKREK